MWESCKEAKGNDYYKNQDGGYFWGDGNVPFLDLVSDFIGVYLMVIH